MTTKSKTLKQVLLTLLLIAVVAGIGYACLLCADRMWGGMRTPRVTVDEASDLEDFDQDFLGIIELEDADDSFIEHWRKIPGYSLVEIHSGRLSYGLLKAILEGADEDQLQLYVAREVEVENGACESLIGARVYSLDLYSARLSSADIETLGAVEKAFTVDVSVPRDLDIENLESLAKNPNIYRVGFMWDSTPDMKIVTELNDLFQRNNGPKVSFWNDQTRRWIKVDSGD